MGTSPQDSNRLFFFIKEIKGVQPEKRFIDWKPIRLEGVKSRYFQAFRQRGCALSYCQLFFINYT